MRLAPSTRGVATVHERTLTMYDVKGSRIGEHRLDKAAESIARFGDEWLLLSDKQKQLARVTPGVDPTAFAVGKIAIRTFTVGRDDSVAVARGDTMELWSRDDERRWATSGGPFTQAAVARDHVVALAEDGALVFFARDKGDVQGALRLASTDPSADWLLAHVDGGIVVLALGEWLVWIDASTRKTVRRVRARAKVRSISADAEHVAVAVEDGYLQAFRASTGEPRASIPIDEGGLCAIALGPGVLFTLGGAEEKTVRSTDRTSFDVTVRSAAPVTALASRGALVAAGDKSGRIRVLESKGGALQEVATLSVGDAPPGVTGTAGLFVSKEGAVVAAGARVVMRVTAPWKKPQPTALRGEAPSAFTADDGYAFSGTQAGAVEVYDLTSGRLVTNYALSSEDRITALLRLPVAPMLVVGTGALDGRVIFVDVADAKIIHRVSPHDEAFGVCSLAADARGRIVASGGDDGNIALLDPVKGRVLAKIRVNETPVSMAFEPGGRRIAAVFADGTAAVVTLAQKGATVADLGLRGASRVAWGDALVFGFQDGSVESGDRHAPPAVKPAARAAARP